MAGRPAGLVSKAIQRLSGDQRGEPQLPRLVSFTREEPSWLLVQISRLPERSDINASFFPSGEDCGPSFLSLAEVTMVRALGSAGRVKSTRQILGAWITRAPPAEILSRSSLRSNSCSSGPRSLQTPNTARRKKTAKAPKT